MKSLKFRKALQQFHDINDATCNTRAAQVFKFLAGSLEFRDKENTVGSIYLGWLQNDGPADHIAVTVAWDNGTYVVDTTIQQFPGYKGNAIFIGTVAEWQAAVENALVSAKKGASGFQPKEKANGVFDEDEMVSLQLRVRDDRPLEDSGEWNSEGR
ncbi:MAG: hypothetical protein ABIQ47_12285 [Tepidiformaceae bacterium]